MQQISIAGSTEQRCSDTQAQLSSMARLQVEHRPAGDHLELVHIGQRGRVCGGTSLMQLPELSR